MLTSPGSDLYTRLIAQGDVYPADERVLNQLSRDRIAAALREVTLGLLDWKEVEDE